MEVAVFVKRKNYGIKCLGQKYDAICQSTCQANICHNYYCKNYRDRQQFQNNIKQKTDGTPVVFFARFMVTVDENRTVCYAFITKKTPSIVLAHVVFEQICCHV